MANDLQVIRAVGQQPPRAVRPIITIMLKEYLMATQIPRAIPAKAHSSEKSISKLLKRLPNDCTVFYEPKIKGKTPDFIVVSPRIGLLVIEVKSWTISYIEEVSNDTVHVKHHGKIEARQNPTTQSRQYMYDIMRLLKESKRANLITERVESLNVKLIFPIGYLVLMPKMSQNDIKENNLSYFFKKKSYGFKEDIGLLEAATPNEMERLLSSKFTKKWSFPRFSNEQLEVITNAIHPTVKLSEPKPARAESPVKDVAIEHPAPEGQNNAGEYIPKSIYDIVKASFEDLLKDSKKLQGQIDLRRQTIAELKHQIEVTELLTGNEKTSTKITEKSEEGEIKRSSDTLINSDCKNIESYSRTIGQMVQKGEIDSAIESFAKMELHAVTAGLKLKYVRELKLLIGDIDEQLLSRSKFESIAQLLQPTQVKQEKQPSKQLIGCY